MNAWLLDTGPIVAFLNIDDPTHEKAKIALTTFGGDLVTSSAVITEVMHFLKGRIEGPMRFFDYLEVSETRVIDCCQRDILKKTILLMQKYADTPMDFADATLVVIGDAMRLNHICTIDRRGFSTFRTSAGKRFHLVLDE